VRKAARRADYFLGHMQFVAFPKTFDAPEPDLMVPDVMTTTFEVPAGSFRERKAQAAEIARELGATTEWVTATTWQRASKALCE
jgi:hypothetical protein